MKFLFSGSQAIADRAGVENMICEGGAGRYRDEHAPQPFGPYEAIRAAKDDPSLAFPQYIPEIGEKYFAATKRGEFLMSNWAEDRFGVYEAKQNAAFLSDGKRAGLVTGIYGWPHFDPKVNAATEKAFGRIVGSSISVLWPQRYAQPGATYWSTEDFISMAYLVSEAAIIADRVSSSKKMIGFVGSPQDYHGRNAPLSMIEEQIRFLSATQTVEAYALWSDANPFDPKDAGRVDHTIAAARLASRLIKELA